jgi:hypothetical protein
MHIEEMMTKHWGVCYFSTGRLETYNLMGVPYITDFYAFFRHSFFGHPADGFSIRIMP